MDPHREISIGLNLTTKNIDQEAVLSSTLGDIVNRTGSFIDFCASNRDKPFTREKYLRELHSQLSISSGYASMESITSSIRTQRSALLPSQSLSVVLQLEETVENERILQEMQSKPWEFHHTMQLLDWENSCVFAKQDFYEISPELPLMSASITATSKNIVRFNLFVKNMKKMQRFYENVLQIYPTFETEDYCCFVLKSTTSYEMQFSLKRSRHLDIFATRNSCLVFQLPRSSILGQLTNKAVIETCDPEGNQLVLVTGQNIAKRDVVTSPCHQLQRQSSSQSEGSSTRVGDCSIIRTRRKTSSRSNSTSESETSSNDSVSSCDGIIFTGRPIVL